jgi:hypothetical protein
VSVAGEDIRLVTRIDWTYRARPAGADRRRPFQARLPAAAGVVRATATLSDGRRASVDRRLSACR